ncbi:MAG: hypothetical protein ACK4LQ_10050 [Pararhodobacter sp.]
MTLAMPGAALPAHARNSLPQPDLPQPDIPRPAPRLEGHFRPEPCRNGLADPALTEGVIDAAAPAHAGHGPAALESGALLMLLAARQTAPPVAMPAATHGLLIRTEFSPPH